MTRLGNGQPFPSLVLPQVGGGVCSLPDDLHGTYAAVLMYRGAWCPYCKAQLAAFRRAADALQAAGVRVVALSVDDEATSTALAASLRLDFPVLHSADVEAVDGTVLLAVYSSGPIGRLLPEDVAGLVGYLRQNA